MKILLILLFSGFSLCIASGQVAIELEKMNVVYSGVVNNLHIAVSDIPDTLLSVTASLGELTTVGNGRYDWKICARDSSMATLTIRDKMQDTLVAVKQYRVKRPPEPSPVIAGMRNLCGIDPGTYPEKRGLAVVLQNFDIDTRCDVVSFKMLYVPQKSDPFPEIVNRGGRFNERAQDAVHRATPGDRYYFYHIKYTCGCDPFIRQTVDDLYFLIK